MGDNNKALLGVGIGIIVFVTILAIISFSLLILWNNNRSDTPLNGECDSTDSCADGLTCINGLCKSNIGGPCQKLTDCIPNSTVCLNGVCSDQRLGGPGERPPCQRGLVINNGICVSQVGGSCRNDTQCIVGARCLDGVCVNQLGGVGDPEPCQVGLVVSDGICKLPDGSCCINSSQCISGSLCDINIDSTQVEEGVCRPIPKTGQMCTPNANLCQEGDICSRSIVLDSFGNNLYPQVKESIIDLTQIIPLKENHNYNSSYKHKKDDIIVILLLEDGNFISDKNRRLKFIESEVAMKWIIGFDNDLYGVSSGNVTNNVSVTPDAGLLYKLTNINSGSFIWRWELQTWAPSNITHLSSTTKGQYLWLQSLPIQNTSETQGFLYRTPTQGEKDDGVLNPVLEQTTTLTGLRNYGNTPLSYIEFSPETCKATLFPRRLPLNNVCYGSILPDGSLFKIGEKENNKLALTRVINKSGVYITHRLCKPSDNICPEG